MSNVANQVLTHRRGGALWISINREDRRNALNPAVIGGIHQAMPAPPETTPSALLS
jgi:enoyl-CoA hydratase/carnithine racemase